MGNAEASDSEFDEDMNTDEPCPNDPDLPPLMTRTRRVKKYSPEAYKFYMEQHVENVIKGYKARNSRRSQLEKEMAKVGPMSITFVTVVPEWFLVMYPSGNILSVKYPLTVIVNTIGTVS